MCVCVCVCVCADFFGAVSAQYAGVRPEYTGLCTAKYTGVCTAKYDWCVPGPRLPVLCAVYAGVSLCATDGEQRAVLSRRVGLFQLPSQLTQSVCYGRRRQNQSPCGTQHCGASGGQGRPPPSSLAPNRQSSRFSRQLEPPRKNPYCDREVNLTHFACLHGKPTLRD